MVVSAVLSAFLDNVTTMLLIIPVSIEIALALELNPATLLIPETFASNVGGTATLIGDPPNMLIGSYANLTFLDFFKNLTPVCGLCLVVGIACFAWRHRFDYRGVARTREADQSLERLKAESAIADRGLLLRGGAILGITILLFTLHGALGMKPCIPAMIGAALLLTVSRVDIVEMLEHEIEWPTLVFFIMIFIVVAGVKETGLVAIIADRVLMVSGNSLVKAVAMVLWTSALVSAFVDNIPFTVAMLPVVGRLTETIPGAGCGVLWWALALGACLGGNGTMIGASANLVTAGMSERSGFPISYAHFFKMAFIPMTVTIAVCTVWLMATIL
jgi:Na+/H+ antiporter NhaD/arsenite permease-like protein